MKKLFCLVLSVLVMTLYSPVVFGGEHGGSTTAPAKEHGGKTVEKKDMGKGAEMMSETGAKMSEKDSAMSDEESMADMGEGAAVEHKEHGGTTHKKEHGGKESSEMTMDKKDTKM